MGSCVANRQTADPTARNSRGDATLVVIDQVNFVDIALFKTKDDPPVCGNRNAPESPQTASQRMEPIPRQGKVRGLVSSIEIRQSKGDSFRRISMYPAGITALIWSLEPSIEKTGPYSGTTVNESRASD